MKKIRSIGIIFLVLAFTYSGLADKPAYQIFNTKGKKVNYQRMLKDTRESHVVFFGELHNNPISHWLQYELTKDLYENLQDQLILAAEMFETDDQLLLNEYTTKLIRKKDFSREAKLWPNYKTDYAPLVDFAREHELKFIASNIPRRYAAIVNSKGFAGLDSINAYQRALVAPLPIKYDSTLNCYKAMKEMFKDAGQMHKAMNLAEAQAIKDATMGWFITKYIEDGITILHYNGAYHSDNFESIVWYVNDYARKYPFETKVTTITCVEQDDMDNLSEDHMGKADFIICIPSSMTKTY